MKERRVNFLGLCQHVARLFAKAVPVSLCLLRQEKFAVLQQGIVMLLNRVMAARPNVRQMALNQQIRFVVLQPEDAILLRIVQGRVRLVPKTV